MNIAELRETLNTARVCPDGSGWFIVEVESRNPNLDITGTRMVIVRGYTSAHQQARDFCRYFGRK